MSGHQYRVKANDLLMQARIEANLDIKNTLLQITQGYGHLAQLAEKNQAAPIVVPPPEQIPRPEDSSEA